MSRCGIETIETLTDTFSGFATSGLVICTTGAEVAFTTTGCHHKRILYRYRSYIGCRAV